MGREIVVAHTQPRPKAPSHQNSPVVQTLPMDEAKKLIRKTSKQHAELFRLLAK